MFLRMAMLFIATTASLVAAPQAVVFDFGGVLTHKNPKKELVIYMLREVFNLSEIEYEEVNKRKKEEIKKGKTDFEFWTEFAKEREIVLPHDWEDSFNKVMKEAIQINTDMFLLVEQLKAKNVPVGLLSNIDERLSKIIRNHGLYSHFDPCLLSCEIGVEKPSQGAYEMMINALGFPAESIVFIDDKEENILAAKRLGLDAILFISVEQIMDELRIRELL